MMEISCINLSAKGIEHHNCLLGQNIF